MKTKLLFFLLAMLFSTSMCLSAKEMVTRRQIFLKHVHHSSSHRSISIPPNIFIEGTTLSISLLSSEESIAVTITNVETGEKVYSNTYIGEDEIILDLNSESAGEYQLELTEGTTTWQGNFELGTSL